LGNIADRVHQLNSSLSATRSAKHSHRDASRVLALTFHTDLLSANNVPGYTGPTMYMVVVEWSDWPLAYGHQRAS